MLKPTLPIRAFFLSVIVVLGMVTQIMIGYSAFANPLHQHSTPTLQVATSQVIELTDARFHGFKVRREIAFKKITHFPWHLSVPALTHALVIQSHIDFRNDQHSDPFQSPRLRPPTRA